MNARDVMTRDVVSVTPDMTAAEVAKLLLGHGISAAPVLDRDGAPIGMISEGDLIARGGPAHEARRDWWLEMLAAGTLSAEAETPVSKAGAVPVRQLMSTPVVSVGESTPAGEVAELLQTYHIKRVPVVTAGHVVGIVSRADLLRLVAELSRPVRGREPALPKSAPAAPLKPPGKIPVSAADFDQLVEGHETEKQSEAADAKRALARRRRDEVTALLDRHVEDPAWRDLLHRAREAAAAGETESQLLRFPSDLCSDGGRAINAPDPDWASTLRGEAAELYLHWQHELHPLGFGIAARVLDFPDGFPGDIGLFLTWGGAQAAEEK